VDNRSDRDRTVLRIILIEGLANLLVLVIKVVVGVWTGSMAVLADALHSLTDLANNIVAWVVIGISSRPADREHPYGHRKFENLAVFVLGSILVVLAFELVVHAFTAEPKPVDTNPWAMGLMALVLVSNVTISWWERRWAKRLNSDILLADASHTFSDVLITLGVIIGWQMAAMGYLWVDKVVTLLVAAMVLVLAYGLFKRAVPVLVDEIAVEPEPLIRAVSEVEGVWQVTKLRSRWIGAHRAVDMVIEVAPDLTTEQAHVISDVVEQLLEERFQVHDISIHIEPGVASSPV